jgi:hypothetical protein
MSRRAAPPACEHVRTGERSHHSRGLCSPCYQRWQHQPRRSDARPRSPQPSACVECDAPPPLHARGLCHRCHSRQHEQNKAHGLPADFDSRLQLALAGVACPVQYCRSCGRRIGDFCQVCAPDLSFLFDGEDIAAARWARGVR